jgi:hypothetical protein
MLTSVFYAPIAVYGPVFKQVILHHDFPRINLSNGEQVCCSDPSVPRYLCGRKRPLSLKAASHRPQRDATHHGNVGSKVRHHWRFSPGF